MFPALAGGFLTTAPPGKSLFLFLKGAAPTHSSCELAAGRANCSHRSAVPSCSQGHRATGNDGWGRGPHAWAAEEGGGVQKSSWPPSQMPEPNPGRTNYTRPGTHTPNVPGTGENRFHTCLLLDASQQSYGVLSSPFYRWGNEGTER